ncbi:hypothetical protein [Peptostreptococcus faecalis]|uniref:hypothetical protein n=1 Tax=Peptostreptococcus faecalis TaxID=2045015 RepID=UPI0015E0B2F4|nr:hypothetical protein [Peptostreptococcus faecalis]
MNNKQVDSISYEKNSVSSYIKNYITNKNITNIIIVGEENSVSKNVENELRNLN